LSTNYQQQRFAYLALAAVCVFWGTTYLAIRIGLEGLPVGFLLAIRYMASGSVLLLASKIVGIAIPRGRELWLTALCGIIGIGLGNGFLMMAELEIPSGLAALFYTTAPFWTVAMDALLPHGKKPFMVTLAGLLVGVLGVAYLIYPAALHEGFGGKTLPGFLLIQISVAAWVFGDLRFNHRLQRIHLLSQEAARGDSLGLLFCESDCGSAAGLAFLSRAIWLARRDGYADYLFRNRAGPLERIG
jgi:drug/metabolite transporter (DMT)-like permease